MAFVKAVRQQVYLKAILTGSSGSGKSLGALILAQGFSNKNGGRIAVIGTEGDRDLLYAGDSTDIVKNVYEYDLLQLEEFSPEAYIRAIDEAIASGYKNIVIDQISSEWAYINDVHDKMPGNSFTNWGKIKPRHRKLIDKILAADAHIICTARGKDNWVLEEKNGKQVPKKVGLGGQTDKDISYEMMLSLQIDQDTHIAHADKDNTGLWRDKFDIITVKDGENLYEWCQTGIKPEPKVPKILTPEPTPADDLAAIKKQIIEVCKEKGGQSNAKLMETLKKHIASGNPNGFKSADKALACLNDIKNI